MRVVVSTKFVAVTVNVCKAEAYKGVPEITPVLVLNESPGIAEILGEIAYVATAPPVEEIVYVFIGVPTVPTIVDDERVMEGLVRH